MAVAGGAPALRFSETLLSNYALACDAVMRVLRGIPRHRMTNFTPCPEWNVRELIHHMIDVNDLFGDTVAGRTHCDTQHVDDAFLTAAFAHSVERTAVAFISDHVVEPCFFTPFGSLSIAATVQHCTNDMLVHAWDLARATGQSTDLAPDVADECLRVLHTLHYLVPRDTGVYGPERAAPLDACPADRLAAFLGRHV